MNAPAADPPNTAPGDTLVGKLVLTETLPKDSKFAAIPIYYQAGFQTAPASKTETPASTHVAEPSPALMADVVRDAQILFLPKLAADAYPPAYAR